MGIFEENSRRNWLNSAYTLESLCSLCWHLIGKRPRNSYTQDNEKIVFLRFSLDILELPGVIISDGNTRSDSTVFRRFSSIDDLGFLDVRTVLGVKYANDPEKKQRKQAEVLVPDRLDVRQILDIICYSEAARLAIERHAKKARLCFKIHVNPGWYFQ